MKFTVITVTYNCASVLEQTILSVLNQDYPDIEYIIIDGKSTDGTLDIIERYKDRITKVISEPDKGIYDAMNKGIALATGDYINFMNAGDRFASPDVLTQVAATIGPNRPTILYGNTLKYNQSTEKKFLVKPAPLKEITRHGIICHQSCFIAADFHKNNLYDISYKSMADYNMFYNAYRNGTAEFQYVDIAICEYRIDEGMSRNIDLNYRELNRILNTRKRPLLWIWFKLTKHYAKFLLARGRY